jgi:hypothetical protein
LKASFFAKQFMNAQKRAAAEGFATIMSHVMASLACAATKVGYMRKAILFALIEHNQKFAVSAFSR